MQLIKYLRLSGFKRSTLFLVDVFYVNIYIPYFSIICTLACCTNKFTDLTGSLVAVLWFGFLSTYLHLTS